MGSRSRTVASAVRPTRGVTVELRASGAGARARHGTRAERTGWEGGEEAHYDSFSEENTSGPCGEMWRNFDSFVMGVFAVKLHLLQREGEVKRADQHWQHTPLPVIPSSTLSAGTRSPLRARCYWREEDTRSVISSVIDVHLI